METMGQDVAAARPSLRRGEDEAVDQPGVAGGLAFRLLA
jgi:hypothetical protein